MLANSDYQILDSGNGRKLEQFGDVIVIRPAAQAIWPCSKGDDVWSCAQAEFIRNDKSGGYWKEKEPLPESWVIQILKMHFIIKPTSFGHMGVFPEAYSNWLWLESFLKQQNKELNVLSLFSYTGGYTLMPAMYGAKVCHVDASKPVVKWARDNAELSGLGNKPIRWIVDDVRKFIKREIKRGNTYHGIIMDPPTYGRGSNGELWKIEEHLFELVSDCMKLMDHNPVFMMMNTYAGDLTAEGLKNILRTFFDKYQGEVSGGEMLIAEKGSSRNFPNGMTAHWRCH